MKHHLATKTQDVLKVYEPIVSKKEEKEEKKELITKGHKSAPTGKRKQRIYSSTNLAPKYTIDDLIAEVRVKEKQKTTRRSIESRNPEEEATANQIKEDMSKCQSARILKLRESLDLIYMSERRQELQKKYKESLANWKAIRQIKQKRQKQQKKQLELQLRERRRQSYAQNLLKEKSLKQSMKFEHETKQDWINTLRRVKNPKFRKSKSKSKPNPKPKTSLNNYQSQRQLYQLSSWQRLELEANQQPFPGSVKQQEGNKVLAVSNA